MGRAVKISKRFINVSDLMITLMIPILILVLQVHEKLIVGYRALLPAQKLGINLLAGLGIARLNDFKVS